MYKRQLYHLTQDTLAHMLFPLGELTKGEVRELARARGFVTAAKPESQDICFVPDGDYARFIEGRCGADTAFNPGEIVDREGRVLGEHAGDVYKRQAVVSVRMLSLGYISQPL